MTLKHSPLGSLQTNCYVLTQNEQSIIVDPGEDALSFCKDAQNPLAIINTHGHFDHVWSNEEVAKHFDIPIIIHENDAFMLQADQFGSQKPPSKADILVKNSEKMHFGEFEFYFFHLPGHSPGTCAVVFDEIIFSGDFVFDRSIGRYDLPYSNSSHMKQSIERFLEHFTHDAPIYPGHGSPTSVKEARTFLPIFNQYIKE